MNDTTGNNREAHFKITSATGLETFLLFIFFCTGCWFLSKYGGGPASWDDLSYLNMSFNIEADHAFLNRYFHVYLLKFFLWVAGDPFAGSRLFWGFSISTTATLAYINARIFSSQSNYLNGLISVLFFYSQWLIFFRSGPFADYTVMMMITAALTVYLLYHRLNQYNKCFLYLLGVIFFLVIQSKETGIIAGILLLGLGFSGSEAFNLKLLGRNVVHVLAGMLIGAIFFMILNQIFIGDAFFIFGVRLSSTVEILNLKFSEYKIPDNNWFGHYIFKSMPAIFILYIISLAKERDFSFKSFEKVVWLLPIGLVFFLTVFMIKSDFSFANRHLLPVIPLMSILAAQFFEFKPRTQISELVRISIALSFVLLFYLFIYHVLTIIFLSTDMLDALKLMIKFQKTFVFPVAFSALLLLAIFVRKWTLASHTAAIICAFLITILPTINHAFVLKGGDFLERSENRFFPFASSENIACSEDANIYVSENIYKEYGMLGRDKASSSWMFNLYFKCNLDISQFVYSNSPEDLVNKDYTYGYITKMDWKGLSEEFKKYIIDKYKVKVAPLKKGLREKFKRYIIDKYKVKADPFKNKKNEGFVFLSYK